MKYREFRLTLVCQVAVFVAFMMSAMSAYPATLVACHFDFSNDSVGQPPSMDPPGIPDGDSASHLGAMGTATVLASSGSLTEQPLELQRASGIGWFHFRFNVDPDMQDCERYTVTWRSLLKDEPYFINIAARSTSAVIMGNIEYRPDGVLSRTGSSPLSVGWAYWTDQLFEFTIDNEAHQFSVSIDGDPVPEIQDVLISSGSLESLSFEFGGVVASSIVVDDVHIVADCENVAAESTCWGSIKSWYR
jgi:hypothetical protein